MKYLICLAIGCLFLSILWFLRRSKDVNKDVIVGPEKTDDEKKLIAKLKAEYQKYQTLILISSFSSIGVFVLFAMLRPKIWEVYWGNQIFFWMSLMSLVIIITLEWVPKLFVRWVLRIIIVFILLTYAREEWAPPPNDDSKDGNIVATKQIEAYGEWIVKVGPQWSQEYQIPPGKRLTRKPLDEKMPFTYWLTLTDGSKKIVNIPPENKMGGKVLQLPDHKAIRIMSPEETKVVFIVEKY